MKTRANRMQIRGTRTKGDFVKRTLHQSLWLSL